MSTPPVALTIAGSDASGGAGIQADLCTFAAHGVYGATAIAALTAQNTRGVQGIHRVPPDFVRAQITSVLDDLDVRATKTGMLAAADIVRAVAELLAERAVANLVVDPVMVSSTGARLLDDDAIGAYRDALLPLARVATPNRHEAAALCGRALPGLSELAEAARELAALGPEAVVITGGDDAAHGGEICDVVVVDGELHELRARRVDTVNDHGTGCTYAAAVAARLARGDELLDALRGAHSYVLEGLAGAADWRLGGGRGPIDHFGWNSDHHHDLQERT